MPSCSIRKLMESPPLPHPKHLKIFLAGFTLKEGDFSLWNGQSPNKLTPLFLRETKPPTISSIFAVSIISCMDFCEIIFFKNSKSKIAEKFQKTIYKNPEIMKQIYLLKPNISCIVKIPFLPTNHSAAITAPAAKPSLE